MKNLGKNLIFWLIAGAFIVMLMDGFSAGAGKEHLDYTEFKQEIQGKKVKSIVYKGDNQTVEAERFNGTIFTTTKPAFVNDPELSTLITEADVSVVYEAQETPNFWTQLLVSAFPLLLLLGIFFLFMRQMQGGVGGKGGQIGRAHV